jgi:hypothetical protein
MSLIGLVISRVNETFRLTECRDYFRDKKKALRNALLKSH